MLHNVSVILVRPRFPENIGMAARAMANMGASDLILIQPERWDMQKALPLATSQGVPVLERVTLVEDLAACLSPFTAAFGTTARTGGHRRAVVSPEAAALRIRALVREDPGPEREDTGPGGHRVALVFGPEDRGLGNEETDLCTQLVTIPVAGGHSSLNLAQAVLLLLYECQKAARILPFLPSRQENRNWSRPAGGADSRRATLGEEQLLLRTLEETLIRVGHLPEDNPGWFMQPMRRFLRKSRLRRHEFDMIMGICRRIRHALAAAGAGKAGR